MSINNTTAADWDALRKNKTNVGISTTSQAFTDAEYSMFMRNRPVPTINDVVEAPIHYNTGEIECIDYIKDSMSESEFIGYLNGNLIKYVHRYRNKNGAEDLRKAKWYLDKLITCVK